MTTIFILTSLGFAGSLAVSLWRLIEEVRTSSRLRLELRGVIDHARELDSKHKREKERNAGYQALVYKLKEGLDRKNALLREHNVSPGDVIDSLLSDEGGET